MKKSIKTFCECSMILIMLFSMGCSDFLNKVPQGNLTQQDFPITSDEALLATNAVYTTLRNWYFNSGGYPILDIMSDDAVKGSNPADQGSTVGPYNTFSITSTQDGLDRWWNALYQGIKYANVVIEKVPLIDMNESLKNQYMGEAKFLRALFYFDLVRAWGGVPIVTTTTPDLKTPRSSKDETYQLVIDDLKFAVDNLPLQSALAPADYGHATKGAAEALLARVYLFQNDFPDAETYALNVINSGVYALDPDFGHTFSVDGQFNSESIFEVAALGVDGYNNGGNQYGNTQGVRGTPNKGWGFNRPSVDFINSFEVSDPRKEATIIFLGEVLDGVTILGDGSTPDITYADPPTNSIIKEIECYNQKVWTPTSSNAAGWGSNRRLIRYADVLLMAAEALNENGKSAEALQYLNEVRARARGGNSAILPDITETNKDLLRDLILRERRSELALESFRFWDLVRTGKAVTLLGPLGFVAGKNELLPIPQTQIDLSQGTLEQNPNW